MKKELTDQQKRFIEVLFDEAGGNPAKAKVLAGYSEKYPTKNIMTLLKEEIIEATQLFLAYNAPKAAVAVISGIDDPTQLGLKEKLNSAKDLLDRVGVVKTEKIQIDTASSNIMILPPKDNAE